jgi:hypothetical protein
MSLHDGLHWINQGLRLFCEGQSTVLPVKEICGGEGLVDECLSSSLYLTMLVIIYLALGLSQGHLQGGAFWGRGYAYSGTFQVFLVKP